MEDGVRFSTLSNSSMAHFSESSCDRCRSMKRRCDRKLPACGNCSTKRVVKRSGDNICIYSTGVKKRGPKKGVKSILLDRIQNLEALVGLSNLKSSSINELNLNFDDENSKDSISTLNLTTSETNFNLINTPPSNDNTMLLTANNANRIPVENLSTSLISPTSFSSFNTNQNFQSVSNSQSEYFPTKSPSTVKKNIGDTSDSSSPESKCSDSPTTFNFSSPLNSSLLFFPQPFVNLQNLSNDLNDLIDQKFMNSQFFPFSSKIQIKSTPLTELEENLIELFFSSVNMCFKLLNETEFKQRIKFNNGFISDEDYKKLPNTDVDSHLKPLPEFLKNIICANCAIQARLPNLSSILENFGAEQIANAWAEKVEKSLKTYLNNWDIPLDVIIAMLLLVIHLFKMGNFSQASKWVVEVFQIAQRYNWDKNVNEQENGERIVFHRLLIKRIQCNDQNSSNDKEVFHRRLIWPLIMWMTTYSAASSGQSLLGSESDHLYMLDQNYWEKKCGLTVKPSNFDVFNLEAAKDLAWNPPNLAINMQMVFLLRQTLRFVNKSRDETYQSGINKVQNETMM
ncbi:hypothetical protein HDU92_006535 [Lobulomyces angularis]|nr:hypothetical protein HDU92_006535 [Lobulomyces angularis]